GGEAGVRPEGHQALLPRYDTVEPADPAGRARRGLPVQRQSAAVVLGRADPLLLRHAGGVLEPRSVGLRAGIDRGPIHLSRGVARGTSHVAVALEPARPARLVVVQVLGGDAA